MEINATQVKLLRDKTGAGFMDCKAALVEAGGDQEKAIQILRTKGQAKAEKKATRSASDGLVYAYIHPPGKLGVMIEINSETDFVAKNEEFKALAHDIAMHIAAADPRYIKPEDVPAEYIAKEKEIYLEQAKNEGKPEKILEKIVEGKVKKHLDEICLINQPFVKDPDKTVGALITEKIAKMGENIVVRRFSRFRVGEEI